MQYGAMQKLTTTTMTTLVEYEYEDACLEGYICRKKSACMDPQEVVYTQYGVLFNTCLRSLAISPKRDIMQIQSIIARQVEHLRECLVPLIIRRPHSAQRTETVVSAREDFHCAACLSLSMS